MWESGLNGFVIVRVLGRVGANYLHQGAPIVEIGGGEHVLVVSKSARFYAVAARTQRLKIVQLVAAPVADLDDVVDLEASLIEHSIAMVHGP